MCAVGSVVVVQREGLSGPFFLSTQWVIVLDLVGCVFRMGVFVLCRMKFQ